jgi:CubicO group peptidase (beta-lactamase class C family)
MSHDFSQARACLGRAVSERAFPGAVVEVGGRDHALWREAFGRFTYEPDASPVEEDTIYDLASLTKVIATATLFMRLVDAGRLTLDDRLGLWFPDWVGEDRDNVTLRQLLGHASGLTAWLPLFRDYRGRRDFEGAICRLALEAPPGTRSIYSDLGFMLAGFAVEDAGGSPLADQFQAIAGRFLPAGGVLTFNPASGFKARIPPTEVDPWRGRLLQGEVHDENAWALGGAAGHAGLFGTAASVGALARIVLASFDNSHVSPRLARPETMREFTSPAGVPASSRALAWDTMRPTSSCGTRMSSRAFGHTGFTGTSLWIDPDAGIYVVLLTNRVYPSRSNEAIRAVRPALHDAVMGAL